MTPKKDKGEARPVFSFRLKPETVERARELSNGNLTRTIELLLRQYNKEARMRSEEYLTKKQKLHARLKSVQREWWEVELKRARASGDTDAVKHYEALLSDS